MINYFFNTFHRCILAFLILILISGCGYKGPPVYEVNATSEVKLTHTNIK